MENKKYIYHTSYNDDEKSMAELELTKLFKQKVSRHLIINDVNIDIGTSVFIKEKLPILLEADSYDNLLKMIIDQDYHLNNYKIIFLKHQYQNIEYDERLRINREIADCIEGEFSLYEPEVILAVTLFNDDWYFGIYEKDNKSWQKHLNKPASFSNSLPIRIARTVVNMAGKNNKSIRLIDPCCGAGTVLLEAYDLGYEIEGYDINFKNLRNCRENLKYFGYNIKCLHSDIKDLDEYYDVAIVDLPYDLYAKISFEEQVEIINNAYRIADKLVLISNMDNRKELIEAGFKSIEECQVTKQRFKRYIFIASKQI